MVLISIHKQMNVLEVTEKLSTSIPYLFFASRAFWPSGTRDLGNIFDWDSSEKGKTGSYSACIVSWS